MGSSEWQLRQGHFSFQSYLSARTVFRYYSKADSRFIPTSCEIANIKTLQIPRRYEETHWIHDSCGLGKRSFQLRFWTDALAAWDQHSRYNPYTALLSGDSGSTNRSEKDVEGNRRRSPSCTETLYRRVGTDLARMEGCLCNRSGLGTWSRRVIIAMGNLEGHFWQLAGYF